MSVRNVAYCHENEAVIIDMIWSKIIGNSCEDESKSSPDRSFHYQILSASFIYRTSYYFGGRRSDDARYDNLGVLLLYLLQQFIPQDSTS